MVQFISIAPNLCAVSVGLTFQGELDACFTAQARPSKFTCTKTQSLVYQLILQNTPFAFL